uniref:Uncharacterized protein n=1 Tax=Caenorhabditis japonica TaxID=281687 RepID=A0A8R1HVC0_CAEJA
MTLLMIAAAAAAAAAKKMKKRKNSLMTTPLTVSPAVPTETTSKSKRRRYFANGRSRTIELSTLAEIDEEEFAKSEGASTKTDVSEKVLTTQDDMCIGTTAGMYKSLKRGSVKAQALKLIASENLAKELEEKSEMEKQSCSKPAAVDVKLRRNLTEVWRDSRTFEVFFYRSVLIVRRSYNTYTSGCD